MYSKLMMAVMAVLLLCGSVAAQADKEFKPKSPAKAAILSMVFTIAPAVVATRFDGSSDKAKADARIWNLAAGTTLGPGLGHLYAGNEKRFLFGTCLRGVMWWGVFKTRESGDMDAGCGCIGVALLSALVDVIAADDSAEKYNREHGPQAITVTPVFDPESGETGVQLSMRF